ncbi:MULTISPECIES: carbohydrate ABC transporter permease [Micrococcaceae]|uniref:Carbohydrate ABC transporter permease n=1 Tax=Paenarthrobacter aromaticivorans TaxID=2849150 RepID=A0ABS6I2P7_9MICC|nr:MULTISPECIES: carbohydrate ABC transporter permease [Micrococcaceae]MBU8865934.1 carbohydrate ABC transporter permease [Paenarthrobacter sp. MMS21-TAE1-1]BCW06277.1 sn-glycerol-3-phosphate transport system permease protein UgpE [Arthrobacter sp. NtRootA1]
MTISRTTTPTTGGGSMKRTRRWQTALHYLILTVVALFFFLPVYYLIVGSFRPSRQVLSGLSGFVPTNLSLDNYVGVFEHLNSDATGYFSQFAVVSIVVTTVVVAGSLIVNSMAAYSFARMKWRGKKVLFLLVIILTIIPFEAVALPLYYMFSGQRDTIVIQAIPFIANAFSIFLFYTFFLDVPGEIEEAARLDGAGPFRTFFQVIIPITKPAFATVAILTFLAQWGSYLWPVLMVSDATVRPLPLAISIFQNQQPPEWGQVLAFGTMFIVPVLAVFLIFQRWFVASISSSAIKG